MLGVLAYSRAFRVYMIACSRAWRAYVFACLHAWHAYVLKCLVCFPVYVHACYDDMFYFLTCFRTWCAFLSYLLYFSMLKFKNSYSQKLYALFR